MCQVGRPAAGDEKHRVEVAEGEDRREQGADQIQIGEEWEIDMDELAPAGRTVHLGCIVEVLRDGHPSGEQDYGPKRHPLPDVGVDGRPEREPAAVEPGWAVDI